MMKTSQRTGCLSLVQSVTKKSVDPIGSNTMASTKPRPINIRISLHDSQFFPMMAPSKHIVVARGLREKIDGCYWQFHASIRDPELALVFQDLSFNLFFNETMSAARLRRRSARADIDAMIRIFQDSMQGGDPNCFRHGILVIPLNSPDLNFKVFMEPAS